MKQSEPHIDKKRNLWQRIKELVDLSDDIDIEAAAENIKSNVRFAGPNVIILFCAIVIASVGLNVNSIPVIIGAMLISPLMAPIVGFGMALGTNDMNLLRSSLKNLGVMVGISILASTLYFLLSPLDMENPTELLARTNPTIYDVLIALFGGFAGIIETSRKEKGTVVVGVAIATALMPPLCTVGYGMSVLNPVYIFGALYLFFINLSFISLAAYTGTIYLGYKKVKDEDENVERRRRILFGIVLFALIVPSILSGISVIRETNFIRSSNAFVAANKSLGKSYIYDYKQHTESSPATIELFIAGEELSTDDLALLYSSAEQHGLLHEQVIIRQEAAFSDMSLNETEIVRDLIHQKDEQITSKNALIANLQAEADSLRGVISRGIIPTEQITNEVRIQYPNITDILLAQTDESGIVMLIKTPHSKSLSHDDITRLEAWLKVRMNVDQVWVINQ